MSSVIEVSGLTKSFGSFTAVDNLSFKVSKGEVYGFIGQNGAGKSTTIRMLLSLLKPGAGEIKIFGQDLHAKRKELLKKTGAIIERPDLYNYLSGIENLSLFAKLSGIKLSRKQLMDQLNLVGLANRAGDKVKIYSLGMKQRLGIAVAIVHNPELIILDEPANGLDPQGIVDIRNLILYLSTGLKKTVFVSSHLLSEVEQIAQKILVIDGGKKIVEGTVKELTNPENIIIELDTSDNTSCYSLLMNCGWDIKAGITVAGKIRIEIKNYRVPELTRMLIHNGVDLFALKPLNTLEQYFLSLTKGNGYV